MCPEVLAESGSGGLHRFLTQTQNKGQEVEVTGTHFHGTAKGELQQKGETASPI